MPALLAPPLPLAVELSDTDRATLLEVARRALVAAVRGELRIASGAVSMRAELTDRRGAAFVTLTTDGELRGCVGVLDSSRPLPDFVAEAAMSAALRDGRFPPVRASELPALHVEVSVLGPMHRLDDPLAFRPGIDGLLVSCGYAKASAAPGGRDHARARRRRHARSHLLEGRPSAERVA